MPINTDDLMGKVYDLSSGIYAGFSQAAFFNGKGDGDVGLLPVLAGGYYVEGAPRPGDAKPVGLGNVPAWPAFPGHRAYRGRIVQ